MFKLKFLRISPDLDNLHADMLKEKKSKTPWSWDKNATKKLLH